MSSPACANNNRVDCLSRKLVANSHPKPENACVKKYSSSSGGCDRNIDYLNAAVMFERGFRTFPAAGRYRRDVARLNVSGMLHGLGSL
jgi:hypothetical protein